MKTIVFPGTFDPLTLGHVDLINRALCLSEQVIIAVGKASGKNPIIPLEQRIELIRTVFNNNNNIVVKELKGLLVDFARANQASAIVRGVRNTTDFDYELQLAGMNRQLADDIETIFLTPAAKYSALSSTLVREVIAGGGDVSLFVPSPFADYINHAKRH